MGCNCCQPFAVLCRLGNLVCISIALLFSILTVHSCQFLQYDENSYAGLYEQFSNGTCQYYDPSKISFGGPEEAARTCGSLAVTFGAVAVILLTWETFLCKLACCGRLIEGTIITVAGICEGLTFLLFTGNTFCDDNKFGCLVAEGAEFAISAMVFYAISIALVLFTFRPEPISCPCKRRGGDDDKGAMERDVEGGTTSLLGDDG